MIKINLLNNVRNASLRYHQAKFVLRRAGIFRYYNPLRTTGGVRIGRSLKVPLIGSRGGKVHVLGAGKYGSVQIFPESGVLRALASLADRTRRTTVWGGAEYLPGHGGMPRVIRRGSAGRALSFSFRTRGVRGPGKYGGLGAFRGQGRGWRRLLRSLRSKN